MWIFVRVLLNFKSSMEIGAWTLMLFLKIGNGRVKYGHLISTNWRTSFYKRGCIVKHRQVSWIMVSQTCYPFEKFGFDTFLEIWSGSSNIPFLKQHIYPHFISKQTCNKRFEFCVEVVGPIYGTPWEWVAESVLIQASPWTHRPALSTCP